MGLKAVSKMSDRTLLKERNRIQKKTGLIFGSFGSSNKDSARLARICREIGKRLVKK